MSRKLRIRQLLKLFNLANRINLYKAEPRLVLNLKTSKLKAKLFMADKENEH